MKLLEKTLEKITIRATLVESYFHSDLLVYRETDSKIGKEVISLSLYDYNTNLKNFLKESGRQVIEWENVIYNKFGHRINTIKERFEILDLADYDVSLLEGENNFGRIMITRKYDNMIKIESEEEGAKRKTPKIPLIYFQKENIEDQKEKLYNFVRQGSTTPMFPNVRLPQMLAGQLFTDKETATRLLNSIEGGVVTISKDELPLLKRAKKLLEWYDGWKSYLFTEMKSRKLLRSAKMAFSKTQADVFEILVNEEIIREIISKGLREKHIHFADAKGYKSYISEFQPLMKTFAPSMKQMIYSVTKPLHQKGDIPEKIAALIDQLIRTPYDAQTEAITALVKALNKQNRVNLIGECGSGKTLMMLSAQWIHAKTNNIPMKCLVLCPDTLVDSVWAEEVESTLPNVSTHIVSSISDLEGYERDGLLDDKENRIFILNHRFAKTGYNLRPSAVWSKSKNQFRCSCCGETVKRKIRVENPLPTDPRFKEVPVGFDFFSSIRYRENYKCKSCDEVLWEPLKKETNEIKRKLKKRKITLPFKARFDYVYYSGAAGVKGFFPRDVRGVQKKIDWLVYEQGAAKTTSERERLTKEIEEYGYLKRILQGKEKESVFVSPQKVSLATYIFKKMRYRFTHLIVDEVHEMQGDSSRSDACASLVNSVKHIITGTGTGMNGYAFSRFRTDFMLFPQKMIDAGFTINDREKYQSTFGVVDVRYKVVKDPSGKEKRQKMTPIPKPGISPIIFPLFMQDTTVFLALEDLYDDLPSLNYLQIKVELEGELKKANDELQRSIRANIRRGDKKAFREALRIGSSFLDMPSKKKEFKDPSTGAVVIETPEIEAHDDTKLQALLKVAENEVIHEGRRMLLYTYYTNDGINNHLHHHLTNARFNVTLLSRQDEDSISCDGTRVRVKKENREHWIREELEKGCEILIVNPELIKTGYNLIDFSTTTYYQMGYTVYTNRQADKRTHRIGQTRDCKIIYLYYAGTMQEDVAALMATKIVASESIEGKMDEKGLQNITNDRTPEEELAKKFYEGIKSDVELPSYTTSTTEEKAI